MSVFIVLLIGLTSLGAYVFGTRRRKLPASRLRAAARRVLEGLGLAVVFLSLNLAIGIVTILGIRTLTGEFVSSYLLNDLTLGILSLLQGLTFQWWRESSTAHSR